MQATISHRYHTHIDPRILLLALLISWLQTRQPACGCESLAASTSSVSVRLIHPDTDTFYSGWDQHFLWHLTLSHTNVTNPSCARPNSSAGNSPETGPPTPSRLGHHQPSPQRQPKPDRDGPSAAPCPLLTLGHARQSRRPPPLATDLSVPALATLLPAAQSRRFHYLHFLPSDFGENTTL